MLAWGLQAKTIGMPGVGSYPLGDAKNPRRRGWRGVPFGKMTRGHTRGYGDEFAPAPSEMYPWPPL